MPILAAVGLAVVDLRARNLRVKLASTIPCAALRSHVRGVGLNALVSPLGYHIARGTAPVRFLFILFVILPVTVETVAKYIYEVTHVSPPKIDNRGFDPF
jgi:hypothetical protein